MNESRDRMKYIVCEEPLNFRVLEKEKPKRIEGHTLLKVNKIGICGTDIHAYFGNQAFFSYPRILGHELATEVAENDPNSSSLEVGDRVVPIPYIACNECIACRNGKTNCCTQMKVLGVHTDGGMQEFINVPTNLLIKTNHLTDEQMAIVEPLAIGAHALRRAQVQAGQFIVVMGCGPIGIGLMALAKILKLKVIALDLNEERLAFVKDKIGVEFSIKTNESTLEAIKKCTNGDLAEVVFDATGNKHALESGVQYMAHGGKYVLVGLSKDNLTFHHPSIHAKETTLMCSRNATKKDFEFVIDSINEFPINHFISNTIKSDEVIENFEEITNPSTGVIKALIEF